MVASNLTSPEGQVSQGRDGRWYMWNAQYNQWLLLPEKVCLTCDYKSQPNTDGYYTIQRHRDIIQPDNTMVTVSEPFPDGSTEKHMCEGCMPWVEQVGTGSDKA